LRGERRRDPHCSDAFAYLHATTKQTALLLYFCLLNIVHLRRHRFRMYFILLIYKCDTCDSSFILSFTWSVSELQFIKQLQTRPIQNSLDRSSFTRTFDKIRTCCRIIITVRHQVCLRMTSQVLRPLRLNFN